LWDIFSPEVTAYLYRLKTGLRFTLRAGLVNPHNAESSLLGSVPNSDHIARTPVLRSNQAHPVRADVDRRAFAIHRLAIPIQSEHTHVERDIASRLAAWCGASTRGCHTNPR
jgi:hypothetical protein